MDLRRIVEPLKAAAEARDASNEQIRKQGEADELAMRRARADKINAALTGVVAPLFKEAIGQLHDFNVVIRDEMTQDRDLEPSQIMIRIFLNIGGKRLQGPTPGRPGDYCLEYYGDIGKFAITAYESLNGGRMLVEGGNDMPVSNLTSMCVTEQVEAFVTRAMQLELGNS